MKSGISPLFAVVTAENDPPRETHVTDTNKSASARIAGRVRELAFPVAERLGYTLWDCRFRFEEGSWSLQIELDSPSGISIDDCERFTRALETVLDAADPIPESYMLEVSSPGIERELRAPEHITASLGSEIEAKLRTAADGPSGPAKTLRGTLAAFDGKTVRIVCGAAEYNIPYDDIKKMKTVFETQGSSF